MGIPSRPSAKNSTALRDLSLMLVVFALWELVAYLLKRKLLRDHPKRKGQAHRPAQS